MNLSPCKSKNEFKVLISCNKVNVLHFFLLNFALHNILFSVEINLENILKIKGALMIIIITKDDP